MIRSNDEYGFNLDTGIVIQPDTRELEREIDDAFNGRIWMLIKYQMRHKLMRQF
jgi:hypothetical protein